MNDPVVQYIIMRNDMDSMTSGRCAAQAAHAASEMAALYSEKDWYKEWQKEAGKFGTTIVLQANVIEIRMLDKLFMFEGANYGVTVDPEYHVADGEAVHLLPVGTCLWVIGKKSKIEPYVSHLELL